MRKILILLLLSLTLVLSDLQSDCDATYTWAQSVYSAPSLYLYARSTTTPTPATSGNSDALWPLGEATHLLLSLTYASLLATNPSTPGLDTPLHTWAQQHAAGTIWATGPAASAPLTPRMILAHADGFTSIELSRYRRSYGELPKGLVSVRGRDANAWRASNGGVFAGDAAYGTMVLVFAIETLTGQSYTSVVDALVARPLGVNVRWLDAENGEQTAKDLVQGHSGLIFGSIKPIDPLPDRFWQATGAAMTGKDIAKVIDYLLDSTNPTDPIFGNERTKFVEDLLLSPTQGFSPAPLTDGTGLPDLRAGGTTLSGASLTVLNGSLYAKYTLRTRGTHGTIHISVPGTQPTAIAALANSTGSYYKNSATVPFPDIAASRLCARTPAACAPRDDTLAPTDSLLETACPTASGSEIRVWVARSGMQRSIFQDRGSTLTFNSWNGPSDVANQDYSWVSGFSQFSGAIDGGDVVTRPSCFALWSANSTLAAGRIVMGATPRGAGALGGGSTEARKRLTGGEQTNELFFDGKSYYTKVSNIYYGDSMSLAVMVIAILTFVFSLCFYASSRFIYSTNNRIGPIINRLVPYSVSRSPTVARRVAEGGRGLRRFMPLRVIHFIIWFCACLVIWIDVYLTGLAGTLVSTKEEVGGGEVPTYYFECPEAADGFYTLYIVGIVGLSICLFGCVSWIVLYSKIDAPINIIAGICALLGGMLLHVSLGLQGAADFVC